MATATNPTTGERLVLIGDAWKPYTQSATGPQGVKAYLVDNAWVTDTGPVAEPAAPTPVPVASAPAPVAPPALAPQQSWAGAEADRRKAAWDASSIPERIMGSQLGRLGMGAVSPIVGVGQLGADAVDWASAKAGYPTQLGPKVAGFVGTVDEMKKRGMAAYGDEGVDIIGGAGSTIAPGGVAAKTTSLFKAGVPLVKRVLQGGAFGYGVGATTPSEKAGIENRMSDGEIGAVINTIIPLAAPIVTKGGKMLWRTTIEPWADPAAIKGRAYLEAAGDKAREIRNFMYNPQELVPGSAPTAGEAAVGASRPQWSALQQSARNIKPDEYLARTDAQKAAQIAQIQTVGQTPKALTNAEFALKAQADIDYPAAIAAGVQPGMPMQAVTAKIDTLLQRPTMKGVLEDARKLARDANVPWSGKWDSVQDLDYIKKALDAKINVASKPTFPAGPVAKQNLLDMKTELLDIVKDLSPAYHQARAKFATDSVPIDQMKVGQFLEGKLTPALGLETANLRANAFANAVENAPATIKKALTDAPRYEELKQVLNPAQLAAVNSIEADLARQAREQLLARAGGAVGPDAGKVGSASVREAAGGEGIPNPLSTKVTLWNAVIRRLSGMVDKKLAEEIATEMLDPRNVAKILQRAMKSDAKQKGIQNFLAAGRVPAQTALTQNAMAE